MEMRFLLGIFVFICLPVVAGAHIPPYNTTLVTQIKPNLQTRSKPTSLLKLASVTFITDDAGKIKFSCAYGWVPQDSRCVPNPCEGFPYENIGQVANCASYESCKSGDAFKFRCSSCKENMTRSNGACVCDRNVYSKSMEEPCIYEFDISNQCTEVDRQGLSFTYYAGCLCPNSWNKCDASHQQGMGIACESYGETLYYNCGCTADFSKTCLSGAPVRAGDYCLNLSDGIRYYDECYFCEINNGEVYNYDDYWCDHEWVNFPSVANVSIGDTDTTDCSPYNLAADECNPAAGVCSYCYGNGLWKYDSCYDGWTMNSESKLCEENLCAGYPSLYASITGCLETRQCKKGDQTMYACTRCSDEYTLLDGNCERGCVYYLPYKTVGCKEADSCQRGGSIYYDTQCTECYEGYRLSNGQCAASCTYNLSTSEGCLTYESCNRSSASGTVTYYQCTSCENGFGVDMQGNCINCTEGRLGARTGTPYSNMDCMAIADDDNAIAVSTECGGQTYYFCSTDNGK